MSYPDTDALDTYLTDLQNKICSALEREDGRARFEERIFPGEGSAVARPRVLEGGALIEKAAVNFTRSRGPNLPPAATERHPEFAGAPFEAVSLSMIVHPENPYVPTTHMNLRGFVASPADAEPGGWLGGGFDLTPYYGFNDDCVHWHEQTKAACAPLGPGTYARLKRDCDEYFFLSHREEPRGIGGLFFDDLKDPDWETCFAFLKSVGDHFLPAYMPIMQRRRAMKWGERERDFQLWRRGRYAEFNLVWDRGTQYGLQSGRRIESVLASLPPIVHWRYDWTPEPESREDRFAQEFLAPRDWVPAD